MKEKYLNQNVEVIKKNGKTTTGIILYWIQENGEREYILINNECIYIDEIEFIQLVTEKDFINHFNKNVRVTMKDGDVFTGHCETITRSADSEYDEPELTIASSKGYYIDVKYSEVEKVENI